MGINFNFISKKNKQMNYSYTDPQGKK